MPRTARITPGGMVFHVLNGGVATPRSPAAVVIKGHGGLESYSSKDGSGNYLAGTGTNNSLVQNGDGIFTETQPDGFQYRYNSSGILTRMQSPAASRWTVVRSTGYPRALTGPSSRRTTFFTRDVAKIHIESQ